ncbi:MAG: hypothetical protein HY402_03855 [Elusimicrobia bacterium]|nr:hypothetical protein [Elusimicrobiota bacterium]
MEISAKVRFFVWFLVLALWGTILYRFFFEDPYFSRERPGWVANPFPEKPPEAPLQRARPHSASSPRPILAPLLPDRRLERVIRPAPLPGFRSKEIPHFLVFYEGSRVEPGFLLTLEQLHANLMLDLAMFSPWARRERVSVYLFKDQASYREVTGRPSWSGGASSVEDRVVYVYRSEEVVGILAHELCHIYFDGFFKERHRESPLWLSEGLATLMQAERGLSVPNWLRPNLETLVGGGGYSVEDMILVGTTLEASDRAVRLWYTQSYSLVRFLLRSRWKTQFRSFCVALRDGQSLGEALRVAYGLPFTNARALEYAWRYDLRTGGISNLGPQVRIQ